MKNKNILIIIISILFLISAIDIQAAVSDGLPGPEVMPDSGFYFLKIWYEKIITFFSFGDARKAERYSKLAERRLYEAEKMAVKGKEQLTKTLLEKYEKNLDKALARIEEMKKEAGKKIKEKAKNKLQEKIDKVLESISESALKNQEVLLKVYGLVPDSAKQAVGAVVKITKTAYENIIKVVSGVKKEGLKQRAEEIKIKIQELIKNWQSIFGE